MGKKYQPGGDWSASTLSRTTAGIFELPEFGQHWGQRAKPAFYAPKPHLFSSRIFLRHEQESPFSGRRKKSVPSAWPCVRRLQFRVRPMCELHRQCWLTGWKWPSPSPPGRPHTLRGSRMGTTPSSKKGTRQCADPSLCSPFFHQKGRTEKKRNETPLNPPVQAASEPRHIWVLLISKYIPSICGPLSNPSQIPEVALTGP